MPEPIDAFTKLLLHCDEVDGSTTFRDSSASAHAVAAIGNAQIDTEQKRFGSGSLLLDGAGDYLVLPDSNDWFLDTGDFTIDFWIRFNSLGSNHAIFNHGASSGAHYGINIDTGGLGFFARDAAFVVKASYGLNPHGMVADTWYHLAFVRSGTSFFMFINGVAQSPTVSVAISTNSIPNIAADLWIGGNQVFNGNTRYVNGWIDEFRISKGIARWTANFTPPSEPYGPEILPARGPRFTMLRDGKYGLWLSRPGVNVLTAEDNDDNFLISPNFKLQQIIQSGALDLNDDEDVKVLWPETLPSPPLVVFQSGISAVQARVPFYHLEDHNNYNLRCDPDPSGAIFRNGNMQLYTQYLALTRNI